MTSGASAPSGSDQHLQFHQYNGSDWTKVFYVQRDAIVLPDDVKLKFGNSADLEIYHNGDNYINIPYDQELRLTHGSDYLARFVAEGQSRVPD